MFTNLQKTIRIPFHLLKNDLNSNVLEVAKSELPLCTEKGYITDINSIVSIKNKRICNVEGNLLCNVIYKVNILMPYVDKVYNGCVCLVFEHGYLTIVDNVMNVFIPANESKIYEVGALVKVKLHKIKFSVYPKKVFSCIGSFV